MYLGCGTASARSPPRRWPSPDSVRRSWKGSPEIYYDLACFESLAEQPEACLVHLGRALELSPEMRPMAAADADFDAVRSHARFLALVAGA